MALLIERLPGFHIGYHCGDATDPAGTVRELHLGFIAITHFRGSLRDLLFRWQANADEAVRIRVERWMAAERGTGARPTTEPQEETLEDLVEEIRAAVDPERGEAGG